MLLRDYEDLFDFVEVTGPEMKNRHGAFFNDDKWRNVSPINSFWLNVSGSPRIRKGKMYAYSFEGYHLLLWVRGDVVSGTDYHTGSYLILRDSGEYVGSSSVLGCDERDALEEVQWRVWLALLEHLQYITSTLEELLS